MQKNTILEIYRAKNICRDSHKTRKLLFSNWKHQKLILKKIGKHSSGKSLIVSKKELAKRLFRPKIFITVKGVRLELLRKKSHIAEIFSTIIEKTHRFHRIKKQSNQSTLRFGELFSFTEIFENQKLWQIIGKFF